MTLIDALWNDPAAQARVELSVTGLTWYSLGTPVALWVVSDQHDLQVGDAIIIEGVTGAGAALLNGRFNISFVAPFDAGRRQFRYPIAGVPPSSIPGEGVTVKRLAYERVFIARRADGQLGSGTQEDPFDGGTRAEPSLAVSLAIDTGDSDNLTAVATATAHGYVNDDMVLISGAGAAYDGTFAIFGVTTNTFKYTVKTALSTGASGASARLIYRFDERMRELPRNTAIHIGPGLFETRGAREGLTPPPGWRPRSGQRITGSGMGATTLKLVGAADANFHYDALDTELDEYMDSFEVSDLTVDCNVDGQPNPNVACGAIALRGGGRHMRFRRVRAIHFGSRTIPYVENFVLFMDAVHPDLTEQHPDYESFDMVIEDCIAEQPGPNSHHNSNIIVIGGKERQTDGVHGFHRGCALRNNYVNAEYVYGPAARIVGVTYDSGTGTATLTTVTAHRHAKPGNLVVKGVAVGGVLENPYNGVFAIEEIVSDTVLTYKPYTAPSGNGSGGTIGGGVSSFWAGIKSITKVDGADKTYIIETHSPHNRTVNNNVVLDGVAVLPGSKNPFNGAFKIDEVLSKTKIKYTLLEAADSPPTGYNAAFVNVKMVAMSCPNGHAAVVEGNRVFHCLWGGPYHDFFPTPDLVVRNNYYHDVVNGPLENLGRIVPTTDSIALVSLTHSGNTATATTLEPHGFTAQDFVRITSANNDLYNGVWQVASVPGALEFTYVITGEAPTTGADGARYQTNDAQKKLTSISYSLVSGKHVATAQTAYARHGLSVGDVVFISKAGLYNNIAASLYNGYFVVQAMTDNTFDYYLSGDPEIDSTDADFSAGYFGLVEQTKRLAIEDNVIELGAFELGTSEFSRSVGVFAYNNIPATGVKTMRQLMIRGNVIRQVAGAKGSVQFSRGCEFYSCEQALVENNVIKVARVTPIEFLNCNAVECFQNQSPAGVLIQGVDLATGRKLGELETEIEDITLMAIL